MGNRIDKRRWGRAAIVAVIAAVAFWWWTRPDPPDPSTQGADATAPTANPIALEYAQAFQSDAWDRIVERTCWMQERLLHAHVEGGTPAARDAALVKLRQRLSDRRVEGNRLRPEGIEDQYVFTRDAVIEPLGIDAGRSNLERPVKDRTWLRVTYPTPATALLDNAGAPIHALTVGINVSTDGLILKAGVIGNLDINRDSIEYDEHLSGKS